MVGGGAAGVVAGGVSGAFGGRVGSVADGGVFGGGVGAGLPAVEAGTANGVAEDPVARIRAANAALFRFARDNREVFRIVFGHAAAYNDLIRRAQGLFIADIETMVSEGVAAGALAPLPPALVAQAVIGMTTQLLAWWMEHEAVPLDTLIDTTTTLILDGLAPGGAEKGAHHG